MEAKDVRYWLNVHSHIVDDAESETELAMARPDIIRFCDEIAAQHEAEVAKMEHRYQQANQMDRDIAGMARLDMEKAQAQVAMMAEALEAVSYSGDWYTNRKLIREAISAAPRVLYCEAGEIQHDYWRADRRKPMTVVFLPADQFVIDDGGHIHKNRQQVNVIVLECPPKGEQGQGGEEE